MEHFLKVIMEFFENIIKNPLFIFLFGSGGVIKHLKYIKKLLSSINKAYIICLLTFLVSIAIIIIVPKKIINSTVTDEELEDNILKNEGEILDLIKIKFRLEEYEEVIELAEDYDLKYTEDMLNVFGVMYANGLYFERDLNKAIQYFVSATDYGTMDSSYLNLFLASFEKDRIELENTSFVYDPYENVCDAIAIGAERGNKKINEILKSNALLCMDEEIEDGYSFIETISTEEKKVFFDSFIFHVGYHRYIVCTDFDEYEDELGNKKFYPSKLEERSIPLNIYVHGIPLCYIILDDMEIYPESEKESIVTGIFEYETSYIDENGNTCFWIDTDNFFYGDTPPADTENSRWIIQGFDENRNDERKYRQQIKQ